MHILRSHPYANGRLLMRRLSTLANSRLQEDEEKTRDHSPAESSQSDVATSHPIVSLSLHAGTQALAALNGGVRTPNSICPIIDHAAVRQIHAAGGIDHAIARAVRRRTRVEVLYVLGDGAVLGAIDTGDGVNDLDDAAATHTLNVEAAYHPSPAP